MYSFSIISTRTTYQLSLFRIFMYMADAMEDGDDDEVMALISVVAHGDEI